MNKHDEIIQKPEGVAQSAVASQEAAGAEIPQQEDCETESSPSSKESEETGAGLLAQKGPAQEHTRSKMAMLFVLGFFGIIFMCFAYAIKVEATLADLKDTLVAIIGALSGTLGFIVGYYYKSTLQK